MYANTQTQRVNANNSRVRESCRESWFALGLMLVIGLSATPFPSAASATHSPLATRMVTNCNASGPGSLPDAVNQANSGDVIDMSGLGCNKITLSSYLQMPQDNLTLRGRLGKPAITSSNKNYEIFYHFGHGTVTFHQLTVEDGRETRFGRGGCITSAEGSVTIESTTIQRCEVIRDNAGWRVQGGAIFAPNGTVRLTEGSRVVDNKAKSNGNDAMGGAIYAGGDVYVIDSVVNSNRAEGVSVFGAGIYAEGKVYVADSEIRMNRADGTSSFGAGINAARLDMSRSILQGNVAVARSGGSAHGGGAYVEGDFYADELTASLNHASGPIAMGGGVYLEGGGLVFYSTFWKNHTLSGRGGGIYSASGTLNIGNSTISQNEAKFGGGIHGHSLTIANSTISENWASDSGGGLNLTGTMTMRGCTVSDNTALKVAGIVVGGATSTPIKIGQSTISGNSSENSDLGAGVYLKYDAEVINTTITTNSLRNTANKYHGAGITADSNIQIHLSNSIIASNVLKHSDGRNLFSDIGYASGASGSSLTGSHVFISNTQLLAPPGRIGLHTSPSLGPLQDNGGATWSHLPLAGSPVIDKGTANGYSKDQRGLPRTVGVATDIGSVEVQAIELGPRIFADGFEG